VEKGKGVKGGLEGGSGKSEVGNFRPGKGGKGGLKSEVGGGKSEVLDRVKVERGARGLPTAVIEK